MENNQKKIAEKLFEFMSNLQSPKGEWIVHSTEFLPANVLCDYAGKMTFINKIAEIIKQYL